MIFQVALWILALGVSLMFSQAFEAQSFALAVVFIALCATVSVARSFGAGGLRISFSPLLKAGAAFWVLALISVILSETRFESFLYFWFFSCLPLAFIAFTAAPEPEKFFRAGAAGFGLIALFLGVSTLAQFLFFRGMLNNGMVAWPMVDPNALAAMLSLGLFGAMGVMLGAQNRMHSNASLVTALVLAAAIIVSGSRAGIVALALVFPVFLWLNAALVKKHKRCLMALGAGAAVIFALFAWGGAPMPVKWLWIADAPDEGLKSVGVRLATWSSAWEMIKDHFWFGTGIGTFFLYYPEYRSKDFVSAGFTAHSDPLQFWAEMGVLAPILFYAFLAGAIIRTMKALKAAEKNSSLRVIIVTTFCALGAMIAHTHVSFHFYVLPILLGTGFLLALWFWATGQALGGAQSLLRLPEGWTRATAWAVCFMPFVLCMGVFTAAAGSDILLRRAQDASVAGDMQSFAADVNAAAKISQNMNARAFLMAASVPIGILDAKKDGAGAQEKEDLYKQALGLLDRAQRLNPRLADAYYQKAVLKKLMQRDDNIESLLQEAQRINPLHAPSRGMLAAHYQKTGRMPEAMAVMKAGLEWPYRDEAALAYYQQAALLFLEGGDMQAQEAALKKMNALLRRR
ncbi:MAG TPA: hypothetical protein DEA55_01560 [Rhodospirillaceae bacterium]|nr:hypothetical protein [Rhodospirillaceae bacterium]